MSVDRKIRLEQKAMPVSSEEELSLITLKEQNRMLSNNYNHRIRIENDLKKRIEQLEGTLRLCEDKEPENQLTIVNEDLRNRVDELEFELNKVRLNERRLNDDLDRLNKEFNDIRRKFLQAIPDSIRNSTSTSFSDQHNHQNTNSTSSSGDTCDSDNSHITWDEYFMSVAQLAAKRSKDPSTKVGACIVNNQNKIVATGYNGMPNGVQDNQVPWTKSGDYLDTKYAYVVHAELNAILNSILTDLRGCRVYVSLFPCNECAKAIIQSGLKHVIYLSDKHADKDTTKAAKIMFKMAGVLFEQYSQIERREVK